MLSGSSLVAVTLVHALANGEAGDGPSSQVVRRLRAASEAEIVETYSRVHGIPVLGPTQRTLRLRGVEILRTRPRSVPPPLRAPRRVDAATARALVSASGLPGSGGANRVAATLVAVPGPTTTRFAWRIDPPVDRARLSNPVFLVDAHDGRIRVHHDAVVDAVARAYARNPVLDPVPEDLELTALEPMAAELEASDFVAVNCVEPSNGSPSCAPAHVASADAEGNFLFDPPPLDSPTSMDDFEDPFAEVSAFVHADRFGAYLDGLGVPLGPCPTEGERTTLVANYKVYNAGVALAVDNAAYTGDCAFTVALGQGKDVDWSYDGDVVTHELTHGVVQYLMGRDRPLNYTRRRPDGVNNDAGALGEAIADFVSNAFMGDPIHGEYVSTAGPGQGRDASNAYTCPGGLVGEVHFDAEPFGGALWDGFEALGDPFVGVVLDAIPMFEVDATFDEAAAAIVAVSGAELGVAAGETVRDIMDARGVSDCPRVADWDALERDELWILPRGNPEHFDPMRPPPVQLRVQVPADADRLELRFDLRVITPAMWEPLADMNVLVKHDAPITFTYTVDPDDEDLTHVDADSELHVPGLNEGFASIPVEPGRVVYLALFNTGLHIGVISALDIRFAQVGSDSETGSDPGTGSTGMTDGDGGSDGDTNGQSDTESGGFHPAPADPACACRSPVGPSNPWILLGWIPFVRRRTGTHTTGEVG